MDRHPEHVSTLCRAEDTVHVVRCCWPLCYLFSCCNMMRKMFCCGGSLSGQPRMSSSQLTTSLVYWGVKMKCQLRSPWFRVTFFFLFGWEVCNHKKVNHMNIWRWWKVLWGHEFWWSERMQWKVLLSCGFWWNKRTK